MRKKNRSVRTITTVAILSALATVLMVLEFSIPLVPSFLKVDFSDLPALLAAFSMGPFAGALVELIKNLLHLPFTQTTGVGELANFLLGSAFVVPAGIIYKSIKTRKGALVGALTGMVLAGAVSFPVNLFITYPFYTVFLPLESIIDAYHVLFPPIDTLPKALLFVNVPFTVLKEAVNVVITFLIYKKISPLLKGRSE